MAGGSEEAHGGPSPRSRNILGRAICCVGIVVSLTAFTVFTWIAVSPMSKLPMNSLTQTVLLLASGMTALYGGRIYDRGLAVTRSARILAATPLEGGLSASGRFVLYLRPFGVDNIFKTVDNTPLRGAPFVFPLMGFLVSGKTQEEQLADVLRPLGELVTVASPDSTSQVAGASRRYLREGEWKPQVTELIRRARFVVICLGASESTLWELSECFRLLPPDRFAIIVPIDRDEYRLAGATACTIPGNAIPESFWFPADRLPGSDSAEGSKATVKGLVYPSGDSDCRFFPLWPSTSSANSNPFATNRGYTALENAFRPLLRRCVEHEQEAAESNDDAASKRGIFVLEKDPDWYEKWSDGIIRYFVVLGLIPGLAGLALSSIFEGWKTEYHIASLVLIALPAVLLGLAVRHSVFPPSRHPQQLGPMGISAAVLMAGIYVLLLRVFPDVRVPLFALPVLVVTLSLASLAISSINAMLDYVLAGVAALLATSLYGLVCMAVIPSNGDYIVFGQGGLLIVVAGSIAGYTFKRRPERLWERVSTREASILGIGIATTVLCLAWTAVSRPSGAYLSMPLLPLAVVFAVLLGTRTLLAALDAVHRPRPMTKVKAAGRR